ncbi:MAG: hypothetical protein FWF15_03030 [Oscillospiraceae bacterium]|nr:hypothetical protein [Oscillospiraceae bacterium]
MKVIIANHECTICWGGVYYFALSDYPNISPWELKKLLAFIDYEKRHGRETEVIFEEDVPLPAKITECTYCRHHGCLTEFVCHTAMLENAVKILKCGKLLSAVKAFGKPAAELVSDKRNAAGDPADYFDYIMFAWGNCQAGDRLVMERTLGRGPTDDELEHALTPGVRFYFRYADIIKHPGYVFDGYHPAKVKDEIVLADYPHMCIAPEQYKSELTPDVYYLPQDGLGLLDWSERVYEFVRSIT